MIWMFPAVDFVCEAISLFLCVINLGSIFHSSTVFSSFTGHNFSHVLGDFPPPHFVGPLLREFSYVANDLSSHSLITVLYPETYVTKTAPYNYLPYQDLWSERESFKESHLGHLGIKECPSSVWDCWKVSSVDHLITLCCLSLMYCYGKIYPKTQRFQKTKYTFALWQCLWTRNPGAVWFCESISYESAIQIGMKL